MVAVALVATLVLGAAACGSSEKTETVSSAQLVTRLRTACASGEQAGRAVLGRRREGLTFLLAQRESLRTTMEQIDQLEATGRASADFDAYKRTVRVRLDMLERIASADGSGQKRGSTRELLAISASQNHAHTLVKRISVDLRMICF